VRVADDVFRDGVAAIGVRTSRIDGKWLLFYSWQPRWNNCKRIQRQRLCSGSVLAECYRSKWSTVTRQMPLPFHKMLLSGEAGRLLQGSV